MKIKIVRHQKQHHKSFHTCRHHKYYPTWNLSIKGMTPASSAGIAVDMVVGVLQKVNCHLSESEKTTQENIKL